MYALRDVLRMVGLSGMPAFWTVVGLTLAAVAAGLYRRHIRLWRLGRPEARWDRLPQRIGGALAQIFGHTRLLADRYAGIMHALLFGATLLLIIVHVPALRTILRTSPNAFPLFREVVGLSLMVGALMAGARRVWRRRTGGPPTTAGDVVVLSLLFVLGLTGVLVNGFGALAPVGKAGLNALAGLGISADADTRLLLRRIHTILGVAAFVAVGYSKLAHLVIVPLNLLLRPLGPRGVPRPVDLERPETFGAGHLADFSWKDLLDLDACMSCGRCEVNCPAVAIGSLLNPRSLIADLKRFAHGPGMNGGAAAHLVGAAVSEGAVWSCTLCYGCAERCPAGVDVPGKILELRRNLVLADGRINADGLAPVLRNLEQRGHPWAGINLSRAAWSRALSATASPSGEPEVLLWVGCTGALVERGQRQTASLVALLDRAEVAYTTLGDDETCCGHFARRLGAEHLFQAFAQANAELIRAAGARRIVTPCPHCLHTLRHEYDLDVEVVHHTAFLLELVRQGRLALPDAAAGPVTYHDPCYLARQNGEVNGPRELIGTIAGARLVEMDRHGMDTFCCGGGGGRALLRTAAKSGANPARARQALQTGTPVVLCGCPNCVQMLEDGLSAAGAEPEVRVLDIAEYMAESVTREARG